MAIGSQPGTAPSYDPSQPPPAPATQPMTRKKGILAGIGALGVAGIAILVKYALPIFFAASMSGALTSVFGSAFEKLPADQRDAMEKRFEAAIGKKIDGLSDAQAKAVIDEAFNDGFPRLADEPLVDRLHIAVKMIGTADAGTCARMARSSATGEQDQDALLAAVGTLDQASVARWYDINIQALEAAATGAPAARTVPGSESDRVLQATVSLMSDAEYAQLEQLYGSSEVPDADACGGFRALYTAMEKLSADDFAVLALYDVSP